MHVTQQTPLKYAVTIFTYFDQRLTCFKEPLDSSISVSCFLFVYWFVSFVSLSQKERKMLLRRNLWQKLLHKFSIDLFLNYSLQSSLDCNGTRTHNHLVRKRTLNHLASLTKWLSVRLRTTWLRIRVLLKSLKLQISCLLRVRSSLTFTQLQSADSL